MLKENGKMNSVELFFYSHGTSNSCGVLITFFGKNIICVNTKTTDKHGRVVILDVLIDWSEFILVNIYIVYKHREWTTKCFEWCNYEWLNQQMKKVNMTLGKQTFLADDFNLFLTVI